MHENSFSTFQKHKCVRICHSFIFVKNARLTESHSWANVKIDEDARYPNLFKQWHNLQRDKEREKESVRHW